MIITKIFNDFNYIVLTSNYENLNIGMEKEDINGKIKKL